MNQINEVNKAVEELRRRTPRHEAFEVLEHYRITSGSYYMALDILGLKLGIKGVAHPVSDAETYQLVGWQASLQFNEGNPLNQEEEEIDYKIFPEGGYADCCVYAAKRQVKALMQVPNLRQHVFKSRVADQR